MPENYVSEECAEKIRALNNSACSVAYHTGSSSMCVVGPQSQFYNRLVVTRVCSDSTTIMATTCDTQVELPAYSRYLNFSGDATEPAELTILEWRKKNVGQRHKFETPKVTLTLSISERATLRQLVDRKQANKTKIVFWLTAYGWFAINSTSKKYMFVPEPCRTSGYHDRDVDIVFGLTWKQLDCLPYNVMTTIIASNDSRLELVGSTPDVQLVVATESQKLFRTALWKQYRRALFIAENLPLDEWVKFDDADSESGGTA